MQKWEYRFLEVTYDTRGQTVGRENEEEFKYDKRPLLRPYLNLLGKKGWEVVAILGASKPATVLLKRPITE